MRNIRVQTVDCRLLHIDLQLLLSVVLHKFLNAHSCLVRLVYGPLAPCLDLPQLLGFYLGLTSKRGDFFLILGHCRFIFSFECLEYRNLISSLGEFGGQDPILFVAVGKVG